MSDPYSQHQRESNAVWTVGCGAFFFLPIIGVLMATGAAVFRDQPSFGFVMGGFGGLVAAGLVLVLMVRWRGGKEAERVEIRRQQEANQRAIVQRASERRRYEQEQERASEEREWLEEEARKSSSGAMRLLEFLPREFPQAVEALKESRGHHVNGAFSPFWSSIERAYIHLGNLNAALAQILDHAETHSRTLRSLDPASKNYDELSFFPTGIDLLGLKAAVLKVEQEISDLVYEAQKEPVYAQIWEQRRTTAAVVTGFANLESAVYEMRGSLTRSIVDLQTHVTRTLATGFTRLEGAAAESNQVAQRMLRKVGSIDRLLKIQAHGYLTAGAIEIIETD